MKLYYSARQLALTAMEELAACGWICSLAAVVDGWEITLEEVRE